MTIWYLKTTIKPSSTTAPSPQRKPCGKRTTSCYRGVKINDNIYSGFLSCGDCGSPMFAMSRQDLRDAATRRVPASG